MFMKQKGFPSDFMQYKCKVPVCGAILLNDTLDKVLLVKGWESKGMLGDSQKEKLTRVS